MKIWYNGQLQEAEAPALSAFDRGFTLGDGLFETLRVDQGVILDAPAHFQRLNDAATLIDCPLPYDQDSLITAIQSTIKANDLQDQNASARLTLSRGVTARGLAIPTETKPTVLITVAPCPTDFAPVTLKTHPTIRRNPHSPSAQLKSLGYLDHILALRDMQKEGADDALLLNIHGDVTETTIANIVFIQGDQLSTPHHQDGILKGIIRQRLLRDCPLHIQENHLSHSAIEQCEAAFLTNSLFGVRPVQTLDGRPLTVDHPLIEAAQKWLEADNEKQKKKEP